MFIYKGNFNPLEQFSQDSFQFELNYTRQNLVLNLISSDEHTLIFELHVKEDRSI